MDWPFADMTTLAKQAECFETPAWAADAILRVESLRGTAVDPCCGRGALGDAVGRAMRNFSLVESDLHNWGRGATGVAFLSDKRVVGQTAGLVWTCFMNPPFSLATQFVERALDLGAVKVLAFQRLAWLESKARRPFWDDHPPARIWLCAERASCWRIDIPPEERERRGATPTAHAWFVWERGHTGTSMHRLYRGAP